VSLSTRPYPITTYGKTTNSYLLVTFRTDTTIPVYLPRRATVLSRLRRADEQWLVDKVASRILIWKASMLNAVGRTTLT